MRILAQLIACADQRTSSGGKAESNTKGMWPNGEPQKIRDMADGKK